MKLTESFYRRSNVVKIARELLGKVLYTNINGVVSGGVIVETEAYSWKEKRLSCLRWKNDEEECHHVSGGGFSYVYLCYGMYEMFNVVTNREGIADAVLIRALEPLSGIPEMEIRRGPLKNPFHLTSGPGKLTKAMGIDRKLNGKSLLDGEVWLEDVGTRISPRTIEVSPRIGIDYAGEDAKLPWRFTIKGSRWISRK